MLLNLTFNQSNRCQYARHEDTWNHRVIQGKHFCWQDISLNIFTIPGIDSAQATGSDIIGKLVLFLQAANALGDKCWNLFLTFLCFFVHLAWGSLVESLNHNLKLTPYILPTITDHTLGTAKQERGLDYISLEKN